MGEFKYGTFSGVFVPTFLSIIGAILYLRLGFVVGNMGIVNSLIIILLSVSVTIATALSFSSIITNIRVGAGAAYSIISKTLGIEVGGSIGIPLYLAQTLSIVFYLFGFTEGWELLFPSHPSFIVLFLALASIFIISYISTKLAIKTQVFVFFLILVSLVSIFLGGGFWWSKTLSVPLFLSMQNSSFWGMFALFFPAATGLMAGVGLVSELEDPKKQVPKGILSAIGITTIIYLIVVLWFAANATPQQLLENKLIIVNLALFGPIVLVGLLAATYSSALTTFVAAPRMLQALAQNNILFPYLGKTSKKGTPRRAIILTTLIILLVLLVGSLDSVAPLITMFFLITYAAINLTVAIEQNLGLVGFRPTFKIPKFVPIYGSIVSIIFMFFINAVFGLMALVLLGLLYVYLIRKKIIPKEGDARSGLFRTIAEWSAKKILSLPESSTHIWKPNVLLPVVSTKTLLGNYAFIKSMVKPQGTLTVLGLKMENKLSTPEDISITKKQQDLELNELASLVKQFSNDGIFTSSSIVSIQDYTQGVITSLEAIESQVFHPNILFLPFRASKLPTKKLKSIYEAAKDSKSGVALFEKDSESGTGSEQNIHVWIKYSSLDVFEKKNFDLAMLIAYSISRNWNAKIHYWIYDAKQGAKEYAKKLLYESRFDSNRVNISKESLTKSLKKSPEGDIHIISVDLNNLSVIKKIKGRSILYVMDSGSEDILA